MEKQSGINTLNFGVEGYGFDQTFLHFKSTYKKFNNSQNIFLIGLIHFNIDRMMLKGRTTNKPYFTIDNGLVLNTKHIEDNLTEYFENYKPKPKIYITNMILGKLYIRGFWNKYLDQRNIDEKKEITSLILKEIKTIEEENNLNLYFVVFYPKNYYSDIKDWKVDFLKSQFEEYDLNYIDLKLCLFNYQQENNLLIDDLYIRGHPNSEANEVLGKCIMNEVSV